MGGDFGPRVTVPAVQNLAQAFPEVSIFLVGDTSLIHLPSPIPPNITLVHADAIVLADDNPRQILRQVSNTSLGVALTLVADGKADACISAGNTGALMIMARHTIGTLAGIKTPAICKLMPATLPTLMLDLGANIRCSASQLVQFAIMGSALASVDSLPAPKVALLNIGREASKGTSMVREAAAILGNYKPINFTGFIEADEIFSGKVDVIVCDGVSGNMALKASQGVARFIAKKLEQSLRASFVKKTFSWILKSMLQDFHQEVNPDNYNGATLLGLKKTVIKSHGSASSLAFTHALVMALEQVQKNVPEKVAAQLNVKMAIE